MTVYHNLYHNVYNNLNSQSKHNFQLYWTEWPILLKWSPEITNALISKDTRIRSKVRVERVEHPRRKFSREESMSKWAQHSSQYWEQRVCVCVYVCVWCNYLRFSSSIQLLAILHHFSFCMSFYHVFQFFFVFLFVFVPWRTVPALLFALEQEFHLCVCVRDVFCVFVCVCAWRVLCVCLYL